MNGARAGAAVAAAVVLVGAAAAFWVRASRHAPTLDDCLQEAAKSPTAQGVLLAKRACEHKFPVVRTGPQYSPQMRADLWRDMYNLHKIGSLQLVTDILGPPDLVVGPLPCSRFADVSSDAECYTYEWNDERDGREGMTFRLETTIDGAPRGAWPDSMR